MVDRAQVQAFLLGYLSGQLGLLIVPDTLFRTWSQPAGTHNKRQWGEGNNEGCVTEGVTSFPLLRHIWWGGSLSTSMLNVTCVSAVVGPVEYVLTFLAVVLIIMQHEAAAALTTVAPEGIDALVLAASIFFGTLVDIC